MLVSFVPLFLVTVPLEFVAHVANYLVVISTVQLPAHVINTVSEYLVSHYQIPLL